MFRFGRSRFIHDHLEFDQIRAWSREAFYYSPATTTRSNCGLEVSPATSLIENRDPKTRSGICGHVQVALPKPAPASAGAMRISRDSLRTAAWRMLDRFPINWIADHLNEGGDGGILCDEALVPLLVARPDKHRL